MAKIKVRHGESLEQALRRFNKEVFKAGILKEARDRERFVKDSEKRRMKKKEKSRKIKLSQNRRFR